MQTYWTGFWCPKLNQNWPISQRSQLWMTSSVSVRAAEIVSELTDTEHSCCEDKSSELKQNWDKSKRKERGTNWLTGWQILSLVHSVLSATHCVCVCVCWAPHPAAPWSGTFRQSRLGCCRLPPRCFCGWMLAGRKGRVALPACEGFRWLWWCEFLWLAKWLVFLRPPFWWATAGKMTVFTLLTGSRRACRWNPAIWSVRKLPGGPGAARCGVFWWVLEPLERLWLKLFLVGPEDKIWIFLSQREKNNIFINILIQIK